MVVSWIRKWWVFSSVKTGKNLGLIILFSNVLLVFGDLPKESFSGIILWSLIRTSSIKNVEKRIKNSMHSYFKKSFIKEKRVTDNSAVIIGKIHGLRMFLLLNCTWNRPWSCTDGSHLGERRTLIWDIKSRLSWNNFMKYKSRKLTS